MLELDRKLHERIIIGDNVVVEVVRLDGDRVKLGIEAPRHIPVHREEVREKIERRMQCEPKS